MIYYTRIEWLVGWLAVEIRGGGGEKVCFAK